MKKKNVLNLIKYHTENNDQAFRQEAYDIAKTFETLGDYQLSEYIMALMSDANTFLPQVDEKDLCYFSKVLSSSDSLPLPEKIKESIYGIVNAVTSDSGVNKFLFQGPPGTGKTESVKHLARILNREIYGVEFSTLVDSKLGQTVKNIAKLFEEINSFKYPKQVIVLLDEIDSIAIDRVNNNDLREMGRATTAILKGLDIVNEKIVLIATTNLFKEFDKALIRRFDYVVDFSEYTQSDLIEIGEIILDNLLSKNKNLSSNKKLLAKILKNTSAIPYPGELKNILRSSIAFSNPTESFGYFKILFGKLIKNVKDFTIKELQNMGFTMREIEILTGVSKSQVSRSLKEGL